MAMVADNFWDASAAFMDRRGRTYDMSWRLPAALTSPEALTSLDLLASTALAISNGLLARKTLSFSYRDAAATAANANAESDGAEKWEFTFTADNGEKVTSQVPSAAGSFIIAGTDKGDPANASMAAYIDAVINGPTGLNNGAVTNSGAQITGLFSGPTFVPRKMKRRR
jgi:hypothetical protein